MTQNVVLCIYSWWIIILFDKFLLLNCRTVFFFFHCPVRKLQGLSARTLNITQLIWVKICCTSYILEVTSMFYGSEHSFNHLHDVHPILLLKFFRTQTYQQRYFTWLLLVKTYIRRNFLYTRRFSCYWVKQVGSAIILCRINMCWYLWTI